MSDTDPGSGAASAASPAPLAVEAPNDAAAVIADALSERRNAPRIEVHLPCSVFVGTHVQDGVMRDASPGGAMLNGVRGLQARDLIRIRLDNREDCRFVAEVRGISLLGVHVAIQSADDQVRWWDAIRELVPALPDGRA